MTTATETAEITANAEPNPKTDENAGNVVATDITTQMESAYLDYAMSVIVSRALPDVRDGLKPVHRRILYAMYSDLNLTSDKPHKKSARIVGEVLGKYHPHGDQSVYDAMVRMAQEFSMRYPLIDGQGNFGSIDGDGAAAMRYTEARLDSISDLMIADLDKDTVDWHENFDNSLEEPDILPAALPNLLINGSNGIAVGMATNIPPHNLGEVIDALAYVIDNFKRVDEITVEELMQFIKGPDFPTGGILYRYREGKKDEDVTDAIAQGYAVGRSRLILQAKAHFEEMSRNRSRIVVTELPYQTNKTALIERIASLVRDGKIEGITDLRDESDRTGMRMVIEMTRNVDAKRILERLFKLTPLQQTFGMQMLSLVDGEPVTLGLRRMLQLFIQHRQEIVRRRTEFDLARAKARAHIVEGLLRALDILDEVIATIRASQRVDTARDNLVKNFKFSKIQAQAILDMQLRRLAALERRKLQDEYKELQKLIKYLEGLLASPKKMLEVIKNELLEIQEKYADVRKTQLVERTKGTLTSTDLLPDQEVWVTVSSAGDLRRQAATKPDGTAAKQVGKDAGVAILNANTKDPLYLFGKDGQCRQVSIHEIPQSGTKHASMYTDFTRRDTINGALTLPRDPGADGYLFMVTELGMVKRVTIADFAKAAPLEPIVMGVDPKDKLGWVFPTDGEQEILLVASSGHSIRFKEADVRSMGLGAGGVGGMKIKKGHRIVYAGIVDPNGEVLTMTAQGYTKRTAMKDYGIQGRNGGGITTHKPSARTGDVGAALVITANSMEEPSEAHIAAVTDKGIAKVHSLSEIPQMGRSVQGKQVVVVGTDSNIVVVHPLLAPQEPLPNGNGNGNGGGHGDSGGSAKTNGSPSAKGQPAKSTSATGASAKGKTAARARKASSNGRGAASAVSSGKGNGSKSRGVTARSVAARSTSGKSRATKDTGTKSTGAKNTTSKNGSVKAANAKQKATTRAKSVNGSSGTRSSGTRSSGTRSSRTSARATSTKTTGTAKSNKASSNSPKKSTAKASTVKPVASASSKAKSTGKATAAKSRTKAATTAAAPKRATAAKPKTAASPKKQGAAAKTGTRAKSSPSRATSKSVPKTTPKATTRTANAKPNAPKATRTAAKTVKSTTAVKRTTKTAVKSATAKSTTAKPAPKRTSKAKPATAARATSQSKPKTGASKMRASKTNVAKAPAAKSTTAKVKGNTGKTASSRTAAKGTPTKRTPVKATKKPVTKAAKPKTTTNASTTKVAKPKTTAKKPTAKVAATKAKPKRSAKLATVTSVTKTQAKKKKTAKK